MKDGYKCANCGRFIEGKGSDVYVVKDMNDINLPTCKISCGEEFKQKEIEKLKNKIDKIRNQRVEKELW